MTVYGIPIPDSVIAQMQALMLKERFLTTELVAIAVHGGIPRKGTGEFWNRYPANHAAHLLLSKAFKEGRVRKLRDGCWAAVHHKED